MTADRQGGEAADAARQVAVADVLAELASLEPNASMYVAGEVLNALDRVRSSGSAAQNQEEMGVAGVQRVYEALARSPQGEDHEADRVRREDYETREFPESQMHPSPERDTRAETERLQRAIDFAYGVMDRSSYVGGPSEREAWQVALVALSEVVTQHKGQGSARAQEPQEEKR